MISCELIGGLGNQMFQIAAAYAHALRIGDEFGLPEHTADSRVWPRRFPHITTIPTWFYNTLRKYHETGHDYHELMHVKNVCLKGFFQSEKYFSDFRENIISLFGLSPLAHFADYVAIHVRRGDYLRFADKHPPVTEEYLLEAISKFKGEHFIIFSDDIEWAKSFAKKNLDTTKFLINSSGEKGDFISMMSCKHQIISNSTFSWWAAWLNSNQDKIVVSPSASNWFGPGNKNLNPKDIIPESWTQIKY